MPTDFLDEIKWNNDGLVPAIAQDCASGKVLMMAWMNREALQLSVESGHAVYWSRSRSALWHKGEQSGHRQNIRNIQLDCDADVVLLQVEQVGGIACHTGRETCFYRELDEHNWRECQAVLKDPKEIY